MQKFMPLLHFKGYHFPLRQSSHTRGRVGNRHSDLCRGISLMWLRDINDPRHWRSHAEEMRVLANGMNDTKTRRIVTRLADGWDKMADRAERRAASLARYLDRNDADYPRRLMH